ncbi:MAG: hypothetical protein ABWY19_05600 [Marmoricola sp.]
MLITNHVVAGAVIGTFAPGPASAFALGIASHAAMDALPHWGHPDRSMFLKVAVVDGLFGLATLVSIARAARPERRAVVVAGMLGACLPDADKPSLLFFGRSPFPAWVDEVHKRIQNEAHERMPYEAAGGVVGSFVARALVRRPR